MQLEGGMDKLFNSRQKYRGLMIVVWSLGCSFQDV